jgi:dTDP-glucose 4,6-dehydratase
MDGYPVPIYGDGQQVRDWIYVKDHCEGILAACMKGSAGQVYNFGGNNEITNLSLTKKIVKIMERPNSKIMFVEDRPGHDRRYAMNFNKAKQELGWNPKTKFDEGLEETVKWYEAYLDN